MNEQEPKNKIGMKVYYDLQSGNVIVITSESAGITVETTREQDFALYKALDDKVPESVGMIQLEHSAYGLDRAEGGIIERVDIETLKPLFSYPDPITQEPQVPGISLSDQISDLSQKLIESDARNERTIVRRKHVKPNRTYGVTCYDVKFDAGRRSSK